MKNRKLIKTWIMVLVLLSIPHLVFADTASDISEIEGARNLVTLFDVYIRGTGAIVLMFGVGELFVSMIYERIEHMVRTLTNICAGLFMICSYSIICKICDISTYNSFQVILSMVSIAFEFTGIMVAMYGANAIFKSLKEQSGEARHKATKIFFGGLAMVAVAQSYFSFLL